MKTDSGTPRTDAEHVSMLQQFENPLARYIAALGFARTLEREAAQLRSELKECREHLPDYGLANFVGQVEDENKQLRADNEALAGALEQAECAMSLAFIMHADERKDIDDALIVVRSALAAHAAKGAK